MTRRKKGNPAWSHMRKLGLFRVVLALVVGTVGGWLAFALAVSGVTRYRAPQVALSFMPGDSVALAARADEILVSNQGKPSPLTMRMANDAVRQQAVNPTAVRLLGYEADAAGNGRAALALVNLATRLSRREAGAQLWLIEHHVLANDARAALAHYDVLLRTTAGAESLLFPRLTSALEDEPIRRALRPYLRGDSPWIGSFLWYAISNSQNVTGVVNLILESGGFPVRYTSSYHQRGLLDRLVRESRFQEALAVYRLVPGADLSRLSNPAFQDSDRDGRFGAVGWRIEEGTDAGGGIGSQTGNKSLGLSVFANAASTQRVASRLLYLRPGPYRLATALSHIDESPGAYVDFQLRCPVTGQTVPITRFADNPRRRIAPFIVPAGCFVQFLDIVISGGNGQTGFTATLSEVAISR